MNSLLISLFGIIKTKALKCGQLLIKTACQEILI